MDGEGSREVAMVVVVVVVVVKYNVSLTLLFALDPWFRAILDEIRVWVYSVLIGPGVISLCNRLILVIYVG